jgi:hypothetical protein
LPLSPHHPTIATATASIPHFQSPPNHPSSFTNNHHHVCQHRKRHRRSQGESQQPQFVFSLPPSLTVILTGPDTSEESKQHSREVLQNAENGGEVEAASSSSGDKNPNNVAGGLKATLNNANTSDEAKESAKEKLNNM